MASQEQTYINEQVSLLPDLPGVYQFLDKNETVIYVGKAKNLKKRVSSYFMDSRGHAPKIRVMVRNISDVRHIIVSSESDALLLENNLIKTLQPRYNSMLKDDKTYPWIVVRKEFFPRVESTRIMTTDGSRFFGPYASISVQRNVLDLIHSLYQIRTCSLNLAPEQIARGRYSVCLQFHLGNCKGPCEGRQRMEDYDRDIEMVMKMLSGDMRSTRRYLEERMKTHAKAMEFEYAEHFKNRIALLDNYISKTVVIRNASVDYDVFSMIKDSDTAYCNFTRIVDGAIVNSFTVQLVLGAEDSDATILTRAISQVADRLSGPLAREVIVPHLPEESLFPNVRFTVPKRGDKLKLLQFSEKNARIYRLEILKNLEIKDPARHTDRILEAMRKELNMKVLPRYIECFDNSNLQGTNPVASCVVFRDAKPSKKEYRHFNVKTVVGPDDFASMREIVGRRYLRLLDENKPLPDLIIIDGGKGQLSAAYGVLEELGVAHDVTIVGLAKRMDEIFFPNDPEPYFLDRTGEPLRVVRHIRDEAHRFGITFHRNKRSRNFITSELHEVKGLGEKSVHKLLSVFKSAARVKQAPMEELIKVVGAHRANLIKNHFAEKNS